MKQIKVSIVIPTRNSSEYISRALDSICAQDHEDIEVLVVDDASEDASELKAIVRSYQSIIDVRVIQRLEKSNAAANRNLGVESSSGEYVCFLDADDIFVENKISIQLDAMIQEGAEWSYTQLFRCKFSEVSSQNIVLPTRKVDSTEGFYNYVFIGGGLIQTSTLMVRADLAKRVRFDEELNRHQDYQYCDDLLNSCAPFFFVKKPLTYWIEENQYRSPFDKGQTDEFCYQYARDHGFGGRLLRRYLFINIVLVAFKSRDYFPVFRLVKNDDISILNRLLIMARLPIYFSTKLVNRLLSKA